MIFNLIILILLFILVEFLLRLIKFFRSGKWQIFAFERKLHIEKHHAYQPHTYLGYAKSNNITNPKFPFEVGVIYGSSSIWRDVKYWNRHVYIGTEAQDGVKVISVDNLDNPTHIYTICPRA